MNNLSHTAAIILAAGKGKRIGSHLPKVLYPLAGRPMVSYVLDTLISIGLKDIFVVTGFRSEDVQASINRRAYFVYQPTPLGTGHAVSCALKEIPPDIDTIIVANGDDSSFYTPQTFEKIIATHKACHSVIAIVSAEVASPGAKTAREEGRIAEPGAEADAESILVVPSKGGETFASALGLKHRNGDKVERIRKLHGLTRDIAIGLMDDVKLRTTSPSEMAAVLYLRRRGYSVVRRGWPDFVAMRGDDVRFIEVKGEQGHMKAPQLAVAAALQISTGTTVEVWPDGDGDRGRLWWDDWRDRASR